MRPCTSGTGISIRPSRATIVPWPRGDHFLDPERPAMHAGFALAGSGVAEGAALGEVRQVDIAPTLCLLLGIEPPAQATGSVLTGALARRQPMAPLR